MGASAKPTGLGSAKAPEPHAGLGPTGAIPCAEQLRIWHEHYGPCDGFGPLWTCSACTGLMGRKTTYPVITQGEVDEVTAANAIGDFLIEKAERAALEAMGCCDSPAAVSGYMRRALIMDFPGEPWRHGDELFHAALAHIGCDKFGSPFRDSDTRPKDGDAKQGSTRE